MLLRLIQDESGQSLVEYGLILGLISVALIAALQPLKANLQNIFMEVGSQLRKASNGAKVK